MWFQVPTPRDCYWVHLGVLCANASQVIFMCKWRKTKNPSKQIKTQPNSFGYIILYKFLSSLMKLFLPLPWSESVEAKGLRSYSRARVWISLSYSKSVVLSSISGYFIMFPFWLQISFCACLPIFPIIKKNLIELFSLKETNFIEATTYHESIYTKLLTGYLWRM